MSTEKMNVPGTETDHLDYVRAAITATPPAGYTRIAADAGMSIRTITNVLDTERDPRYSTVKRLYEAIRALEVKAASKP